MQNPHPVKWGRFAAGAWDMPVDTTISADAVKNLGAKLTMHPEDFKLNSRVARIVADRKKMAAGEQLMDWGFCENLAYASLIDEGYPIRLSGEDCGRGTFFHRHAVFHEQESGAMFVPLQHLSEAQMPFVVIDSLLSEEAVLAFEYGYATTEANTLVIWEAQDPLKVTRLVMCSGKVYYDLLEQRRKAGLDDVALVRIEQIYPFPEADMNVILDRYPNIAVNVWCQEEPLNQGAWLSIQPALRLVLGGMARLDVVSRPASASPAVGSAKVHAAQQQELVNNALGIRVES